ncbi:MAG TPA: hypothetical protein PLP99_10360 [Ignavibacteriales bacterium]|nr:hypothetical protein [Ignavibacteriales bacterium]HOL82140.1 hypothetical protein [Ignavibacteriales bacterium]HOM65785.1 hypothetical protein [Ignavibacteriales bacterium]HPP34268.1 hypothetical protein [Ignavibacteriales bacterium]
MGDFIGNIITFFIIYLILSSLFGKKKQPEKPKTTPREDENLDYQTYKPDTNKTFDIFYDEPDIPQPENVVKTESQRTGYKSFDVTPVPEHHDIHEKPVKKVQNPLFQNIDDLKKAIIFTEIFGKPKANKMKRWH